ncbi:hypothetical protein A2U01_0080668, partial [Trifolium medium]|nr:hypothetical protein [Trifolium medium]
MKARTQRHNQVLMNLMIKRYRLLHLALIGTPGNPHEAVKNSMSSDEETLNLGTYC